MKGYKSDPLMVKNSIRPKIEELLTDKYSAEPEYPWKGDDVDAVFRHNNNRKWFGLIMTVRRSVLGMQGEDPIDILNVKCDPVLGASLHQEPGFLPGYHMNHNQWLTILLDGTVPIERIDSLISLSYDLTDAKVRKRNK